MHYTGTIWRPPYEASSFALPLKGNLPGDRPALLRTLDHIIETVREADLQDYRKNLPHL